MTAVSSQLLSPMRLVVQYIHNTGGVAFAVEVDQSQPTIDPHLFRAPDLLATGASDSHIFSTIKG